MKLLINWSLAPPIRTGENAGNDLRQINPPEHREWPPAERLRGAHQRWRDRTHHAVDRQQRKGQLDMRHGDDQPCAAIHQFETIGGQAEPKQEIVEQTIFL
jgi:hypothetical protein